jgi:hypothetical protein
VLNTSVIGLEIECPECGSMTTSVVTELLVEHIYNTGHWDSRHNPNAIRVMLPKQSRAILKRCILQYDRFQVYMTAYLEVVRSEPELWQ